jgi:uncharacterized protein (DUF433 family)
MVKRRGRPASGSGSHPVIAGTGFDVWEVIATWKVAGLHEEKLRQAYH